MWFCTDVTIFIRIRQSLTELWRYVHLPRWRPYGHKSTSDFWFYDVSHLGRQGNQISTRYLDPRPRFLAVDRDIWSKFTTSAFWKQTAAILKLYLRFRFWSMHCHRQVTLHDLPNFMQIRWSPTELWRHIDFRRWGHSVANLLPGSNLTTSTSRKV